MKKLAKVMYIKKSGIIYKFPVLEAIEMLEIKGFFKSSKEEWKEQVRNIKKQPVITKFHTWKMPQMRVRKSHNEKGRFCYRIKVLKNDLGQSIVNFFSTPKQLVAGHTSVHHKGYKTIKIDSNISKQNKNNKSIKNKENE
jgi:hypothetical protein